jgi:ATP adenylyltransferase
VVGRFFCLGGYVGCPQKPLFPCREIAKGFVVTFDQLIDFIENRMRMSHIYQPLLIRSLVDSGGSATVRQLAQAFLIQDESQLLYYEKRIKEMPIKVLSRHEVLKKDGELVTLNIKRLTLEQKAHLRGLCEQKLQKYVQQKGLSLWDYRLLETGPVPDDLRYQVLSSADHRCALCGITAMDRPLDVDHIIPRSRGGSNDISNLQTLCSKCNRTKGNKDDTDFRAGAAPEKVLGCLFCADEVRDRTIFENGSVFAAADKYSVTPGHLLVIPKRHAVDYFEMTIQERQHAEELLRVLKSKVLEDDPSVKGFNVGMNCGEVAGQTVMHAHIHLIPRRVGDVEDPRGGVRGCVPEKMGY